VVVRLLRSVALGLLLAAVVWGAAQLGSRWGMLAAAACLLGAATVWRWLPRAAHRRFRRGDYRRAALYYRLLRGLRLSRETRAGIDVSLAACALAREEWERASALLERIDPEPLSSAARAAWLNNRGYALARGGGDCAAALHLADQALALRPDVAGFRHTRGLALLGLGRVDEAVRELDSMWGDIAGDEQRALLEAERCFDLGRAWRRKGEIDYARDYFERARRAAPGSRWSERAQGRLGDGSSPGPPLADLIEP
jgi:tetratricopeptide (TPR) repeat protein